MNSPFLQRLTALAAFLICGTLSAAQPSVAVHRTPNNGMKPSVATDSAGAIHMVYFTGKPDGGDAYYVVSKDGGATFSKPVRVNSQSGSVQGISSIRGPKVALGAENRAHVIWNGNAKAQPRGPLNPAMPSDSPYNGTPLLYARMDDAGTGFEPQRNLMQGSCALDGGSAIAADASGNVYAVWHALPLDGRGEADRTVWLSISQDNGRSFSEARSILPKPSGVCACCSVAVATGEGGSVAVAVRSAEDGGTNRPMNALLSWDHGATFSRTRLDQWLLQACPMSSAFLLPTSQGFEIAWEGKDGVLAKRLGQSADASGASVGSSETPGVGSKHPALAANASGQTLFAWTEGMGWNKGGSAVWEVVDMKTGRQLLKGRTDGVPAHGSLAAIANPDGGFTLFY